MNLISLEFIIFLIITFIIYYIVGIINNKFNKIIIPQWSILLVSSLVFYGFVNYFYLIFIGISSVISFVFAYMTQNSLLVIKRYTNKIAFSPKYVEDNSYRKKYEKIVAAIPIVLNVIILAILKYYNFFASSINSIFNQNITIYKFIIPLGISFYTFSLIAYNVDAYKRKFIVDKNIFKFLLFITYFPKVLQGPISNYDTLEKNGLFEEKRFEENEYSRHFLRIFIGVVKKVAIANVVGMYVDGIFNNISDSSSLMLVIGIIFYSIQLYCDFSGFLDMSIGISGLFGIKLEENFNTPYLSSSIQEFWKRWHISLGKWLRNYIYIPLGGNRVPKLRWVINTIIVWLVSGIWHGANWTYIVWGLYFGLLLVISKLISPVVSFAKKKLNVKDNSVFSKCFSVGITFILVTFGWIFFRSPSILIAVEYIKNIFNFKSGTYNVFEILDNTNKYLNLSLILILLLILGKIYIEFREKLINKYTYLNKIEKIIIFILIYVLAIIGIYMGIYLNSIGGGESSFIYFDF